MKKLLTLVLALAMLLSVCAFSASAEELVDGKFAETKHITVEIYNRNNDGGTDPTNNVYTDYIKQGMLDKYNVEVEFVSIGRWTEVDDMNTALAAGDAPDVCVTYSYPTIQSYATMGGIINLNDIEGKTLEEYKDMLPNLWNLLGDTNIFWDQDPDTGDLWAVEATLADNARINTFIRKDWLDKLGLELPTTEEEFHACLEAFRDNAETLLGADADKMVPYSTSYDIGWRNDLLFMAYVPDDAKDEDLYINGFDDRHLLYPNYKEGVRVLNKWYNEGLVWKDFAEYASDSTHEDDMMKAGFVGAFQHNWDYPYRGGEDSIQANLQRNVGEDAAYVAVDTFVNDAGLHRKFLAPSIDRKVFFPATNQEPIASLLYLDFISDPETIAFLQLGAEGETYNVVEGGYEKIATTGDYLQNSLNNIDYTITVNGLYLGDATAVTTALGYEKVASDLIVAANAAAKADARIVETYHVGAIDAEQEYGTRLPEFRDSLLNKAVTASEADFDAVYDQGMDDYLANGGQEIIDERAEKLAQYYGYTAE